MPIIGPDGRFDIPGGPLHRATWAPVDSEAEAATEAGFIALGHAERTCILLDRYADDWGSKPDVIEGFAREIEALNARIVAALGEPRAAR